MTEIVLTLLENKDYKQLRELLINVDPADLAILLSDVSERQATLIFRLLPNELAAETFVELEGDIRTALIASFSDNELREVLDELYNDDVVDLIEEMPATVVRRILNHTDDDRRQTINQLLRYPKDSAGSIMTTEFVSLKSGITVEDAFSAIRRRALDKETIYNCYVKDGKSHLIGVVSAKDLLLAEPDTVIDDIMHTNFVAVTTHDDKEEVALKFSKYDLLAAPVVDSEGRLVGIVTFDDAMDVIEEEATEDIERMAAITPTDKPYMQTGVFESWRTRVVWLILLMLLSTFTGMIITRYETALTAFGLAAFMPMLMNTGGNAGGQTSATVVRGLSLGEIRVEQWLRVLFKEMRVALLCGLTMAVATFIKLMLIDRPDLMVAVVVSATLLVSIVVAKIVGSVLPILAKLLGFDPAVMASPFITTVVDAISLMIYFAIATALL